jgi:3-hydroxyisobutyrate dehydrogenase-like beta-hydroxyacid dehydrogenase
VASDTDARFGVGVVGLGNIGGAMASRLVGWPGGLTVFDVRPEAMQPLVDAGARGARDLADLAATSLVVSVIVLDDAQVREVVAELVGLLPAGSVIAVHSTIEVNTAPELAALGATRGIDVVDAPISGGAIGAAEGRLAAMVGGEREAYDRVKPVFAYWAELIVHLGPAGAGTRAKLARMLLTFVGFAAAGEAQRLAEAAGVDLAKLAAVVRHSDAITGGPAAVMIRGTTAPYEPDDPLRTIFEHTRSLGEKDLSLALSLGESIGLDLPFARLGLEQLAIALGVPHASVAGPARTVESDG